MNCWIVVRGNNLTKFVQIAEVWFCHDIVRILEGMGDEASSAGFFDTCLEEVAGHCAQFIARQEDMVQLFRCRTGCVKFDCTCTYNDLVVFAN